MQSTCRNERTDFLPGDVAAGPIMTALAGMGIPEYEAKRSESYIKDGGILLSVHVDDSEWEKKAKNLLETTGAKDISCSSEVKGDGDARFHARDFNASERDLPSTVSPSYKSDPSSTGV